MAAREKALTRFMYANLYHHPQQLEIAERMAKVVSGLAEAYRRDPALLPDNWRASLPETEPARTRHIGDFIAGMTDRYALTRYAEHVGPVSLEGF
jgi:dGTPase